MAEETSADMLYSGNYSNFIIDRTDHHRPLFEVLDKIHPCDLGAIISHLVVGTLGLTFNIFLLYLIIDASPKSMSVYKLLLMSSAITEALICLFAIIVMVRHVPVPPWSLVYVTYGFCQFFGSASCYEGYMIMLHLFTHSSLCLLMSFFYRYYALIKSKITKKEALIAIALVSLPSIVSVITLSTESDDPALLRYLILSHFPEYYVDAGTISGHSNILRNFTVAAPIGFVVILIPSTYPIIIILRTKILKIVAKARYSPNLYRMHTELLRALTMSAMIPVLYISSVTVYFLLTFQVVRHPFYEDFVFVNANLIPALSPLVSIFFISPYNRRARQIWQKLRCRKMNSSVASTSVALSQSNDNYRI